MVRILALFLLLGAALAPARTRELDYAVILQEPAIAAKTSSRSAAYAAAAAGGLARIQTAQRALSAEIERRKVRVTGSAQWLVNAVFVRATREQAKELRSLAGVKGVVYLPPIHMNLGAAADLANAPAAWNAAGGVENAGAGVKIAIIDSGIDHTHPAFQDPALQPPPGFPKGEAAYTNGKIIVARSWVHELPYADVYAYDSRPDDVTPRDRQGHGTAIAAIAAGVRHESPKGMISGIAPKAWIGNYKIFGSPGINDTSSDGVLIQALEAAFEDGMDIAALAIGDPAIYGPLDQDPELCSPDGCDLRVQAVEEAIASGMTVVVSAGNDGTSGKKFPTLSTINTPGTAPSAITVGASTNSHRFYSRVRADGREFPALFGDGPRPAEPVSAPLRDTGGELCFVPAPGSLTGTFAIIDRGGNCAFVDKVLHAQFGGAAGVIIVDPASDEPIVPLGLASSGIPTVMVGSGTGAELKALAQRGEAAELDPALYESSDTPNLVAEFSSRGPALRDYGIKPELVAPGTGIYTATQNLDPNAELYNPTRYTAVTSTSFAVGMVAGAAALVKQRYLDGDTFTPAHIKSAVVNTAAPLEDESGPARVISAGAGLLNVAAARAAVLTAEPATLSFGNVSAGLPPSRELRITNHGDSQVSVSVTVNPRDQGGAQVAVSTSNLNLGPRESASINISLTGGTPSAGSYEGFVVFEGGGTTLRVPYLYVVGSGQVADIYPIVNREFVGAPFDTGWPIAFRVVDENGVGVAGVPVFWEAFGGAGYDSAETSTDSLGVAFATVSLGDTRGMKLFRATAGGLTTDFFAYARQWPIIRADAGVINAADGTVGQGLAPGSYASIFGDWLADFPKAFSTNSLPFSLGNVSVSFDVPDDEAEPDPDFGPPSRLSVPGRLSFVSPGQINVQIPWELQGHSRALVKVTVEGVPSTYAWFYQLPLHPYSPALFPYLDPGTGRWFAAAQHVGYELISPSNPATREETIVLYANGLGPTDPQPASGEPSPASPLAETVERPTATIGGLPATVEWSGMTPGSVGLYQVHVNVPRDLPSGDQPVVITIGGVSSAPVNIPVE